MAKVLSLNISKEKGVIKTPVQTIRCIEGFGFETDAHGGDWHRQVSLLANESIEKMKDLGATELKYGNFAENMTTEGIVLYKLAVGTMLKIGEILHRVTQIGKECHHGCAIKKQTGNCIMPKEGIFTEVVEGGKISIGDEITIF